MAILQRGLNSNNDTRKDISGGNVHSSLKATMDVENMIMRVYRILHSFSFISRSREYKSKETMMSLKTFGVTFEVCCPISVDYF